MKNTIFLILLLASATFAQHTFELKNASKYFDIKVNVAKCDENSCTGKASFSFYKKGSDKAYQVINFKRFAERWKADLAFHRPSGTDPFLEADRTCSQHILLIDAVTPTPDMDSGSLVTLSMAQAFQELGYEVTFIPQSNYKFNEKYTAALHRAGIHCVYEPFYSNVQNFLLQNRYFDVVLVYRFSVAGK